MTRTLTSASLFACGGRDREMTCFNIDAILQSTRDCTDAARSDDLEGALMTQSVLVRIQGGSPPKHLLEEAYLRAKATFLELPYGVRFRMGPAVPGRR